MKNKSDIVALNDSQILRWICELNGIQNLDLTVSGLKNEIKAVRKQPKSKENRDKINIITAEVVKYFCGTKTRLRLGGK